jgi:hypothetical protein
MAMFQIRLSTVDNAIDVLINLIIIADGLTIVLVKKTIPISFISLI